MALMALGLEAPVASGQAALATRAPPLAQAELGLAAGEAVLRREPGKAGEFTEAV